MLALGRFCVSWDPAGRVKALSWTSYAAGASPARGVSSVGKRIISFDLNNFLCKVVLANGVRLSSSQWKRRVAYVPQEGIFLKLPLTKFAHYIDILLFLFYFPLLSKYLPTHLTPDLLPSSFLQMFLLPPSLCMKLCECTQI